MVIAIIQARMASSRLPNKVMMEIKGKPMLWHVVSRVRRAKRVDRVVVATSISKTDDAIAAFCKRKKIGVYRGSEHDVLDRFYQTARHFKADTIVRITADCPLIDPFVIDRILAVYNTGNFDYVSNTLRYTYPDGLDTEVFSFQALEKAHSEANSEREREHVVPYIKNSGLFRIANVECETDLSQKEYRWTVDEMRDLLFIREVYRHLGNRRNQSFGLQEVHHLLSEHPELMEINKGIIMNEGGYRTFAKEPPVQPTPRKLSRSMELKAKAELLIPGCSQTFSKAPSQFVQGVAPVFIARGKGSHVWDVDGNEYIDYPMGLGPVILGHNYPAVTAAVIEQMNAGTTFSLPHPLEVELAEMIVEIVPCAEMVRFGKNGSDATSGAIRVARAYTGRDIVACCGYHGWQDWYIGTTTRDRGVPESVKKLTIPFNYNDVASLERIFAEHPQQVAAVIMEPIGVSEPAGNFLQKIRELTPKEGALLIFDEIITGFRLSLGGAQEYFGITPDLACFGKAMGNGYPISVIAGRKEIMRLFDEVFYSFTFGGEILSLAASKATIREMKEKNVIAHLWGQGTRLKDGFNVLAREYHIEHHVECIGLPPRTVINFKNNAGTIWLELKSLFQQECLKRGILFTGGQNICFSHSNMDVEYTLRVYRTVLEICAQAIQANEVIAKLEGKPVSPVFRQA